MGVWGGKSRNGNGRGGSRLSCGCQDGGGRLECPVVVVHWAVQWTMVEVD